MKKRQNSLRLGLFVATTGLFVSGALGGCALVLGLEERTEAEPVEEATIDEETEIETNDLCIEYCDTVSANCENENAVYAARASCINTCNALPPGLESEPAGNTVQCRLRRAKSAEDDPNEFCAAAGPGGDNGCGSNCDAWCHLLESECPGDFELMNDCLATCETIADEGGFNVDDSYARDDIQCRLIHLGAVADDEVHCEHARYVPSDFCTAGADGPADCDRYCDIVMGNCFDDRGDAETEDDDILNAVYESRGECMAACAVFPLGELSDRTENTIGCRTYHATASADDPSVHCDHAGPTGDGHCGVDVEEGHTGNCDSHCLLLEAGCPVEFALAFGDVAECSQTCAEEFDQNGAEDDAFYGTAVATESDSLQCRTYYAVKAVDGDASACEKALLTGTCD